MRTKLSSIILLACVTLFSGTALRAQDSNRPQKSTIPVVMDNDYCGDPDGLFQLVQQVLTPSCEIKGIIGGHVGTGNRLHPNNGKSAEESCKKVQEVLDLLGKGRDFKIVPGAAYPMQDMDTPNDSQGARLIIEAAKGCSQEKPLYVVCGGSLTNIASALLQDRSIEKNIILVWIGGEPYDFSNPLPSTGEIKNETNLHLDLNAARFIFGKSEVALWQIPQAAYKKCLYPLSSLELEIKPLGEIGEYLYNSIHGLVALLNSNGYGHMDTYTLGDNPLVLVTGLMGFWDSEAASCEYKIIGAPEIDSNGTYDFKSPGRDIRVYTDLDTYLLFHDMESKLKLHHVKAESLD